jgi:transglutaminase/protease-like cytokinesis protein 3
VFLIYLAYEYRDNIHEIYYDNFVSIEEKTTKLEKNDYYRDYNFSYAKNTNDFVPTNKKDILNIYYTIVNSGMTDFTFFCPKDYSTCIDDVNDLANDQNTISNINNFVHPYNSFKTLKTEVDSTGKIDIHIEKVYDNEMIILLNYKVDEIMKNEISSEDYDIKDKIKKIHNYIIDNTTYDKDRSDNKIVKYKSDNAYGVLIENYGLCGGYTDAMMLFLEKLNVPNYKIATENHIWNYVKIENDWYHLDLTWDDPIANDGKNIIDDSYFLIDDNRLQELEKDEHIYNADIYSQ